MFLYNYIYFLREEPGEVISCKGIGYLEKEGKVLILSLGGNMNGLRKYLSVLRAF